MSLSVMVPHACANFDSLSDISLNSLKAGALPNKASNLVLYDIVFIVSLESMTYKSNMNGTFFSMFKAICSFHSI